MSAFGLCSCLLYDFMFVFFFYYTATTEIYTYCHTLSLHDSLPISTPPRPRRCSGAGRAIRSASGSIRSWRRDWRVRFRRCPGPSRGSPARSEEHTSELQSLMRISYAVFCLKKKKTDLDHSQTTPSYIVGVKHHINRLFCIIL